MVFLAGRLGERSLAVVAFGSVATFFPMDPKIEGRFFNKLFFFIYLLSIEQHPAYGLGKRVSNRKKSSWEPPKASLDPPTHLMISVLASAARSGVLRTSIEYAGGARHTIQLWDELRTWDPGD